MAQLIEHFTENNHFAHKQVECSVKNSYFTSHCENIGTWSECVCIQLYKRACTCAHVSMSKQFKTFQLYAKRATLKATQVLI